MEEAMRKLRELRQENQELLHSAMTWNQEVSRLKQVLADKDKQLRSTLEMRTVDHDDTLNVLNGTMVELEERREEGAPKEEITRLEEEKVEHQRELFGREGRFMERIFKKQNICLQISNSEETPRKQLLKLEKTFKEELKVKEEEMKLQLLWNRESFMQKRSEELTKFNRELAKGEEAMRKQLSDKEHSFRDTMTELCQQWEERALQWSEKQKQLEELLEEKEKARKELEEANKLETQHLEAEICKVQDPETRVEDIALLKELLADQSKKVRIAIKKQQMRSVAHTNTLNVLSSTKVELEETLKKCDILKEDHAKQVEELKDDHQRELSDRGERLKEEFSKEQRKCLQKIVNTEENYKKQLQAKREKFNEELKQKEEKMRMSLLMNEENERICWSLEEK
eukprot:XP_011608497.1 PREDICTED: golgin subfamily A member 6-like protein 22 [Takifugu rubripes]